MVPTMPPWLTTSVPSETRRMYTSYDVALAAALQWLVNNQREWAEIAERGRQFVLSRFDIHRSVDRLEEEFHELLRISQGR